VAHLALAQSHPLGGAEEGLFRLSVASENPTLNWAQAYTLFGELDRLPGIMEPRVGLWRAWPMAKMQLAWHLLHAPSAAGRNSAASLLRKAGARLPRYAGALPRIWRRFDVAAPSGAIGMLYVPRMHCFRDGRQRDFIFGELLSGAGLKHPVIALRHPLAVDGPSRLPRASQAPTIDLAPYHLAAEQLALVLMAGPRLRRTAAALNGRLDHTGMAIERSARGRRVLLALALFEARRRIFRRLFERLALRALVVSYAPGRHGEIAAARELGLPVIELQHGVIGAHCPDYVWPRELEPSKAEMPLPDRIAVFGPTFRDLVLSSGFWSAAEVVATGAAAMEAHRSCAPPGNRRPGPLRLLFMTQAPTRIAATAFWRELAASSRFVARDYQVAIKLHPEETQEIAAYQNLVSSAPERVRLLAGDVNPIDAMLAADVVVSYNSMALIEALALGRAAISICGGPIPDGFAGTFGLPEIVGAMPHVNCPEALLDVLCERAGGDGHLAAWHSEAQRAGQNYFSDNFTANTTALINDIVTRDRCARGSEPLP
jgi:hypothetical protein